jgi:uncharacterized surface protein with fasciclin (FAS1) repeats
MKRISIIFSLLVVLLVQYACNPSDIPEAAFKDGKPYTIYNYIVENKADYSSFLSILEQGGLDKTLSAYNPNGTDYTLFLPSNKAVDNFIKEGGKYASLDALLKDNAYCAALGRYHVVNGGYTSNKFPFGTFNEPSLTGDYLNVNFILAKDTTYYKINNQAPIIKANIKAKDGKDLSNGVIHVISTVLKPITLNSYSWLKQNTGYSIFLTAIDATGINKTINVDMKEKNQLLQPFTLLVEPDVIYKRRNINSLADLAKEISPDRNDYTNPTNPLYLFVAYHFLTQSRFLDDLQSSATNYNTFADVPLNINGLGLDITINQYKEIFITNNDTTDFVGLDYDASNIVTQSGAIHLINQIMKPQVAGRSIVTFEFYDEPTLNDWRYKGGSYLIENPLLMKNVKWQGSKLFYVKSNDATEAAWSKDYLQIDGDFIISYQIPKIVQGKYTIFLQASAYSTANALVEVYIDGVKIGGLLDLTRGGNQNNPYFRFTVGTADFKKYASHNIEIRSLIPGRLVWDYIRFEPL